MSKLNGSLDTLPMNFEAYESQVVSNSSGEIQYVKWTVGGEPMPCTAVVYYKYKMKSTILEFLDNSCYTMTYAGKSFYNTYHVKSHPFITMMLVVLVGGVVIGSFYIVKRKSNSPQAQLPQGYRNLRFSRKQKTHDPAQEALQHNALDTKAETDKTYSSLMA